MNKKNQKAIEKYNAYFTGAAEEPPRRAHIKGWSFAKPSMIQ